VLPRRRPTLSPLLAPLLLLAEKMIRMLTVSLILIFFSNWDRTR
jgi:hypothetical protein